MRPATWPCTPSSSWTTPRSRPSSVTGKVRWWAASWPPSSAGSWATRWPCAAPSTRAPQVSQRIDALFANSLAETLTETEKAFQLSFVSMSEAILLAVRAVSFIIILIIMAVMANTMTMTARERLAEYATAKALGFRAGFVVKLLFGESLLIALIGGGLGIALTFPMAEAFVKAAGTLFPIFRVSELTVALQVLAALVVGGVSAACPARKMSRIDIVQGLRHVA